MKKILSVALAIVLCLSISGCATTTSSEATGQANSADILTMELQQNDFRGGYTRSTIVRQLVFDIVEEMKGNNEGIRADNPNSYWISSGYQDFVSNFINSPIANDMQWFNEEETTFEEIQAQMIAVPNSFTKLSEGAYIKKYDSMLISRIEKDQYMVSNIQDTWVDGKNKYNGEFTYNALYDCDKDWCKAYCSLDLKAEGIPQVTTDLFEYARASKDIFLIQTSQERLYVKLKPVEGDVDLRERKVEEFYYSRLGNGQRTTFVPFVPYEEEGWETSGYSSEVAQFNRLMASYPIINLEGDLATRYGINDSLFENDVVFRNAPTDWVFEDKALQQTIVYKNGNLVVTTYNKLSKRYEQYIYYYGNKADESVVAITPLNELVGIPPLPEAEPYDPTQEH